METPLPETAPKRPHRSIEDFRGDFENLASFVQKSWAENESRPLLYTADVLASYFSYPGATFSLAPTLYEDSQIVAFVAGFPRRVHYKGKELSVIITAFLTVATDHKKSGYGILLWSELVKRARKAGFAGVMSYSVENEPMSKMMLGCYQRMSLPASRIFSVPYLTRFILSKPSQANPEGSGQWSVGEFLEIASKTAESTSLGRLWTLEEAEWQCQRRGNSIVVSHSAAGRQGFLTGCLMSIADGGKTRCLVVEDVLWNDLTTDERHLLVQKLVDRAAFAGARMVVVPVPGYADPEPFLKSRFLRSTRTLHAYLGLWDKQLTPEQVGSFYVDIF
jgi:hypothetical protein